MRVCTLHHPIGMTMHLKANALPYPRREEGHGASGYLMDAAVA